jgi:hypothetical protein
LPATLVFGADGRLLAGEAELACVEWEGGPGTGRVTVGEHAYEVARRRRSGWRFDLLRAPGGRVAWEFHPHLLRRGGLLRGDGESLALRPKRLGSSVWRISGEGRATMVLVPQPSRARGLGSAGTQIVTLAGGSPGQVVLTSSEGGFAPPPAPEALAFACWLVLEWIRAGAVAGFGGGGGA